MFDHGRMGQYDRSHSYDTRFRADLLPNQSRMTIMQNSIFVVGPNIWNSIPLEIQNSLSRESFKYRYKMFLQFAAVAHAIPIGY